MNKRRAVMQIFSIDFFLRTTCLVPRKEGVVREFARAFDWTPYRLAGVFEFEERVVT
jgi:hypothetical protein